jgi:quinohemoprotein ethanol dehydrogenase
MRNQLLARSTHFSFPISKCAIAVLCCAFSIEPLFAQEVDWAHNGGDVNNSRFQSIDQINPSNVSQLKPAWTFSGGPTDPVSLRMTPIVVNGVMYITGSGNDVFALNPTTGKQIWHYTPSDMPAPSTFPSPPSNKGVAYGQGLVFEGRLDATLVALNAKTGAVVWKTPVDPGAPANGAGITIAPQFINASNGTGGTVPEVLVGVVTADFGVRGHLDAYNPATGKLLWRFWTTEPASWAGDTYLHGGASIWQTPTFDSTLNMVYVGTGNAATDYITGRREGTNLYTDSLVALDATTGELQWFFQMIHHDMWDFDSAQPAMLFSWNGVPAIEGTTKAGYTFILDRASGESLFPYEEKAVPPTPASAAFQHPWPTQPVSSIESLVEHQVESWSIPAGAVAVPEFTAPSSTAAVYAPNYNTGYEWPPAAYSPRTHMIYSHAMYAPLVMAVANNFNTSNCEQEFTDFYFSCGLVSTNTGPIPGVNHGVYGAINTLTGKIAWTIPILTSAPNSGMTVAGDLVFFGDSSGLFYAASAATGEIVWVFDAMTVPNAGGANSTGAAVYEVGGVEYVAYEFGGGQFGFGSGQFVKGNALIAFALPSAVAAAAAKSAAGKATVR